MNLYNKDADFICAVCGKPKFIPGKLGRQFHPACSRKLQLLLAGKGESKKSTQRMTNQAIEYFAKTGAA